MHLLSGEKLMPPRLLIVQLTLEHLSSRVNYQHLLRIVYDKQSKNVYGIHMVSFVSLL